MINTRQRQRIALSALGTVTLVLSGAPASAAGIDLFIGTLAKEGKDIVLTRCDLAENRYVLVDAKGFTAVADLGKTTLPAYGEVIGHYTEQNGHSVLRVERIDGVTPGRNCHLMDALDRMAAGSPTSTDAVRGQLAELVIASATKSRARDYAGAVAILKQAEALVAANKDTLTEVRDQFGITDLATAHGDALKDGRLGDPCPFYALARENAQKAATANDAAAVPDRGEIADTMIGQIDAKAVSAGCKAAASSQPTDQAFVGHYYLSGVMETGSELLLEAKGNFQWFLSYGAMDQTAQGTWRREGSAIVLTTTAPATGKPLFAYLETEAWSKKAEEEKVRRQHDVAVAAVRDACPFLTDSWVSSPTAVMSGDEKPKPSAEFLRQQAATTLATARDARARVEALARTVMAKGAATVADDTAEQIRTLLSDWLGAKDRAQEAAVAAGLPDPGLADPVLPAACAIPKEKQVSDQPATWTGGIGVRVYDRTSERGASNVQIALRFADGHSEQLVTAGRGLALLPGTPATAAVGVTLHADYAKGRDASFTFAPVKSGIIHFSIDGQQLATPPFTTLRLKIAGKALIPEIFGKGRYERQP